MAVDRLDPPVRAALRLGLYQLLFLDRVPAYAAVDASVRLARVAGAGARGLVNPGPPPPAPLGRNRPAPAPAAARPLRPPSLRMSHPPRAGAPSAHPFGLSPLPPP